VSRLAAEYDPTSPANQRRLNHQAAERNGERILPEFDFEEVAGARKEEVSRFDLEFLLTRFLRGGSRRCT
jgi:hypothetical protein